MEGEKAEEWEGKEDGEKRGGEKKEEEDAGNSTGTGHTVTGAVLPLTFTSCLTT